VGNELTFGEVNNSSHFELVPADRPLTGTVNRHIVVMAVMSCGHDKIP
jgi:hypothetical protein